MSDKLKGVLVLILSSLAISCGTAQEKASVAEVATLIFLDQSYSSTPHYAEESACAEARGNCIDAIRRNGTGDCRKIKGGSYPNPGAKVDHMKFYGYCEYNYFK